MGYDLAEEAVEYASQRGATYAEARFERIESTSFLMKNSILEVSDYSRLEGMGIRVLVNGSMAFTSMDNPGRTRVKGGVEAALRAARSTARLRRKPLTLSPAELGSRRWRVKEKHPLRDVSTEEGVALLEAVDRALLAAEARVPARFLHLTLSRREKRIVNSEGVEVSSVLPLVTFYYLITVAEAARGSAQRSLSYSRSAGWEAAEEWDLPGVVSREATALAENLREGRKAPKGGMDVIAGSEIVGIAVHESAGHPCEADRILGREGAQAGESFIRRDMLGTRIGSEAVTVVDDPGVEESPGYYLCDDEGVKARRRVLIKEGVINGFLLNRESAAVLGVESNAAARASSYDREPLVRMSTTYMLPGEYGEEELLEGVRHGVYIRSFMEWNIDDARYHQRYVGCEAYLIEEGELSSPVRQPVLELTTPAFYGSIDALSKNVEFYAGNCGKGEPVQSLSVWLGGPTARLRNVRLR